MTTHRSAQPGLYCSDGDPPSLHGQQCGLCNYVQFPSNPYGCDSCGATLESLSARELAGSGKLAAFATIHLPMPGGAEPPTTVATIILDDGPAIGALLTVPADDGLAPGLRVHATLVRAPQSTGEEEIFELRFTPERSG